MQTLDNLLTYCQNNNIQLTEQQILLLDIILQSSHPISATELLDALKIHNPKANRMTIHRGLERLTEQSLIHKIQFNNTYSICQHISNHNCQMLVCIKCNNQTEIHSHNLCHSLNRLHQDYQFTVTSPIEITGICSQCNSKQ
jgi:Fe2+ or Zn2+ uptake regulation protein